MVEMTPEHLENQVEIELGEGDAEGREAVVDGILFFLTSQNLTHSNSHSPPKIISEEDEIVDFGVKLVLKMDKDGRGPEEDPKIPVDPLSLSSLLSQGFDESDARRALRLHNNDTQAAMVGNFRADCMMMMVDRRLWYRGDIFLF